MKLKKLIVLILLIPFLVVFLIYIFNKDSNYVLKINQEKISKPEFETYLYEQKKSFEEKGGQDIWETDFNGVSAKEVAKQNAINSILLVKSAVINAPKLNISLTKEELNEVKSESNNLYKDITSKTNIELDLKTATKITKENKIQKKVFENLTSNFELSENDFNLYFNNFIKENKKQIQQTTASFAFIPKTEKDSLKITQEVYNYFVSNKISSVLTKYPNISVIEKSELNNLNFEENIEEKVYNLKENEVSPIIEVSSGYYVFKILKIKLKDLNMLKEEVKNDYILNKKLEIYNTQYESWVKDISLVKNEEVWNLVSVKDIQIKN